MLERRKATKLKGKGDSAAASKGGRLWAEFSGDPERVGAKKKLFKIILSFQSLVKR
jgi:hypothetical protein